MAISGGTLAAVLGALGVGGYLWWKKAQSAQGQSACQKMVATAAAAGGYPTSDALTKSVCGGIDSLLSGGVTGITKLPGVQIAGSTLGKVAQALPWVDKATCSAKDMALCPTGGSALNVHYAKDLGFSFPSTVNGAPVCAVCVDKAGLTKSGAVKGDAKVIGVVAGGAYRPWAERTALPQVIPVNQPTGGGGTLTEGRTSGGVTVSSSGGSLWSKFIS